MRILDFFRSFSVSKEYYFVNKSNKIDVKILTPIQKILRNVFGFYKETHLKKISNDFCQLDLKEISLYPKEENYIKKHLAIINVAKRTEKFLEQLEIRRQRQNVSIANFQEKDKITIIEQLESKALTEIPLLGNGSAIKEGSTEVLLLGDQPAIIKEESTEVLLLGDQPAIIKEGSTEVSLLGDQPAIIKELQTDINFETHFLHSKINKFNFSDIDDLSNFSQIYFEIQENKALLDEFKMKYQDINELKSILGFNSEIERNFISLEEDLNQLIIKQAQPFLALLNQTRKDLDDSNHASNHEWKMKIYLRCLEAYNNVFNPSQAITLTTDDKSNKEITLAKGIANQSLDLTLSNLREAPIGIINGGSNCYAISTMQALLANPFFVNRLETLSIPFFPKREVEDTEGTYQAKLQAYENRDKRVEEVQKKLKDFFIVYASPYANSHALNRALIKLRNTIFDEGLHPTFVKEELFSQQDAADFCSVILEAIEYSFNLSSKTQAIYQGPETLDKVLSFESIKKNPYQLFQLSINESGKSKNLDQLLAENILEQINDETNPWRVELPTGEDIALSYYQRSYSISNQVPPEMLCFQIKRYGYGKEGAFRIADAFPFDTDQVNLAPLVAPGSDKPLLYRLVSCVNHHGQSIQGGHYTSYVKKGKQWFDCNDSIVRPCSTEHINHADAYLLMLEKIPSNEQEISQNRLEA